MMDRCVAGLANVTPFRGVSADVGTAFEMGYLFGCGRPVWGYTSHVDDYATRIAADVVDDGELLVEAFGLADNLMLEGPMLRRDHTIVRVPESGPNAAAAFSAFEIVVRLAAAELRA
jgi:nucleoside 2-deoxyribosyltransferase